MAQTRVGTGSNKADEKDPDEGSPGESTLQQVCPWTLLGGEGSQARLDKGKELRFANTMQYFLDNFHANKTLCLEDFQLCIGDLRTIFCRLSSDNYGRKLRGLRLSLKGNGLMEICKELRGLTYLTALVLDDNNLVSLPEEIGELTAMSHLHCSVNHLSTLPSSMSSLTHLTRLFLDHNDLERLPPEIGQLTELRWLSLDYNKLRRLPPEISGCKKLGWLSLEHNLLTELPEELPSLLFSLNFLSVLGNPSLTTLPRTMSLFSKNIFNCHRSHKERCERSDKTHFLEFQADSEFCLPVECLPLKTGGKLLQDITGEGYRAHHAQKVREIVNFLSGVIIALSLQFDSSGHLVSQSDVLNCMACNLRFSLTRGKCNCPLCGLVLCRKCGTNCTAELPVLGKIPICILCKKGLLDHTWLDPIQGVHVTAISSGSHEAKSSMTASTRTQMSSEGRSGTDHTREEEYRFPSPRSKHPREGFLSSLLSRSVDSRGDDTSHADTKGARKGPHVMTRSGMFSSGRNFHTAPKPSKSESSGLRRGTLSSPLFAQQKHQPPTKGPSTSEQFSEEALDESNAVGFDAAESLTQGQIDEILHALLHHEDPAVRAATQMKFVEVVADHPPVCPTSPQSSAENVSEATPASLPSHMSPDGRWKSSPKNRIGTKGLQHGSESSPPVLAATPTKFELLDRAPPRSPRGNSDDSVEEKTEVSEEAVSTVDKKGSENSTVNVQEVPTKVEAEIENNSSGKNGDEGESGGNVLKDDEQSTVGSQESTNSLREAIVETGESKVNIESSESQEKKPISGRAIALNLFGPAPQPPLPILFLRGSINGKKC